MERTEIHISLNGDDNNTGTESDPLQSLHAAQSVVQHILKGKPGSAVNVIIHSGTYYLEQPLIFGKKDSGTEQAPVVWQGENGKFPVISGGRRLDCSWEPYENGIWKCSLPEYRGSREAFTQLYVNGRRQIRARYPNGDSRNPDIGAYAKAAGADHPPYKEIYVDPENFEPNEWKHPEDAVLHIFRSTYWGNLQYRLKDFDRERNALILGVGGWQISSALSERSRFFVENVFEELDAPGEWFLDTREGVLYYMPDEDVDLSTAVIEVSVLKHAIEIIGTVSNPVSNVEFEGLRFAHTETTYLEPYSVPSRGDWSIYRGGCVLMEGASNCQISNCHFEGLGGNAVFINGYAEAISVTGSKFEDIGESAVCLVGESHLNRNGTYKCKMCDSEHSWSWDEPSKEYPSRCYIHNNLIHDIGVFGKQTAGVFISLSEEITVSHNHIFDVPRAGICINDGLHGGHIIEYNDVHDTVRETGDHGPFNSWGREPYWCRDQGHGQESHPAGDVLKYARKTTVIKHNRFRDTSGWGIDLDDGSSNYHVYGNLCIGISVKLREGDYRLVENNIFIHGANPPAFHRGYEENHDRFVRNIIVTSSEHDTPEVDADYSKGKSEGNIYDIIAPPLRGLWFLECDYNLFISNIGRFRMAVHYTRKRPSRTEVLDIAQWRAMGFDQNSLLADPMFRDAEHGDYRLKPESPAFNLGFKELPLDRFGLTEDFKLK